MTINNNINPDYREQAYLERIYRIYEFDDGLYFSDMKFRCGSLDNYVKTGILTAEELRSIREAAQMMEADRVSN